MYDTSVGIRPLIGSGPYRVHLQVEIIAWGRFGLLNVHGAPGTEAPFGGFPAAVGSHGVDPVCALRVAVDVVHSSDRAIAAVAVGYARTCRHLDKVDAAVTRRDRDRLPFLRPVSVHILMPTDVDVDVVVAAIDRVVVDRCGVGLVVGAHLTRPEICCDETLGAASCQGLGHAQRAVLAAVKEKHGASSFGHIVGVALVAAGLVN